MAIAEVVEQSVQNTPPIEQASMGGSSIFLLGHSHNRQHHLLSPYGSKSLDIQLREFGQNMWGSLWMGARTTLAKQAAATPFVIKGKRRVRQMQSLLQTAGWGIGWQGFMESLVKDFATFNIGAIVEIVGAGKIDKPLIGMPTGIKLLDPIRCYLTGIPETPIVYENFWIDVKGDKRTTFHLMHESRVHRIVDMPDSDERLLGMGESAFYRYIGHHYRQILMSKYTVERLSDQPPAGFLVLGNVREKDIQDATTSYEADRTTEGQTVWRNIKQMQALDPQQKIDVQFVNFSNLPEGFDYRTYNDIDRNIVALSLGIDPQDIAPLTGGLSGTSGQSQVLNEKSKSLTIGLLYKMIETMLNTKVFPPSAEFEFKPEDTETGLKNAQRAQAWTTAAGDPSVQASAMERRQLLANTVNEWHDVLTDDDGVVVTLPDTDIREEPEAQVSELDDTEQGSTDDDAVVAEDTNPLKNVGLRPTLDKSHIIKEYLTTRKRFIKNVEDALKGAQNRDFNRTRFSIIMRGHLARDGRAAFKDGMSDGGVQITVLQGDDKKLFNAWMAEQSAFVTDLGRSIYQHDAGIFFDSARRADSWGNKSLNSIYQQALASADKNGLYKWKLGSTKEHCKTCRKADGQVHRMKEWIRAGVMPQGNRLICGGFQCKCTLTRVTGQASGRLRRIPRGE
jgi:hypothetical protein